MVIDFHVVPYSTLLIMGIAIVISFVNMGLNRLLITRLVGWNEYRTMQKEINEHRSQQMAAMRSKDTKLMEKLKKKDSQIQSMQTRVAKPQLYLLPISFSYIVIWIFFLTPFYGNNAVAYLPGFAGPATHGGLPVVYFYFLVSLLFGTIASRIVGVTPLDWSEIPDRVKPYEQK
jgi:uncharacterized membrane protein (DUF106 family)